MMDTALPAVAGSVQLGNSPKLMSVKLASSFIGNEVELLVYEDLPANSDRAPHRIRGFGSSDTYLYKRTLLI
jgi:hypothetical protein